MCPSTYFSIVFDGFYSMLIGRNQVIFEIISIFLNQFDKSENLGSCFIIKWFFNCLKVTKMEPIFDQLGSSIFSIQQRLEFDLKLVSKWLTGVKGG